MKRFDQYISEKVDLEKSLLSIDSTEQGAVRAARKKHKGETLLMIDSGIYSCYKINNNFEKIKKVLSAMDSTDNPKFKELRI